MKKRLQFLKTALRDKKIGAITGSSKYSGERVSNIIPQSANVVVEYGPGQGVMTRALLKVLSPSGTLIAIESNPDFLKTLSSIRDPRLRVIQGNAESVHAHMIALNISQADAVISTIPFSFLKPAVRDDIVRSTHSILRPGGSFVVFQYSPRMSSLLKKYFHSVEVSVELRNLPPGFIIHARK